MPDQVVDLGFPIKSIHPTAVPTTPEQPAALHRPEPSAGYMLPSGPAFSGARSAQTPGSSTSSREVSVSNFVEPRTMGVGPGISLSGEIKACDRLVIEGSVQASLQKCQYLSIAESGIFDGSAEIEEAEIRGRFEGDLVVRKRLRICAGGRVSGRSAIGRLRSRLAEGSRAASKR
jgi:cytoskeletal protein CcmA (bactofilin family)